MLLSIYTSIALILIVILINIVASVRVKMIDNQNDLGNKTLFLLIVTITAVFICMQSIYLLVLLKTKL